MTLAAAIAAAWDDREVITSETGGAVRAAVEEVLAGLDSGEIRVALPQDGGGWVVQDWVKKAILLSFRLFPATAMGGGPDGSVWYDRIPLKTRGWTAERFAGAGFRSVPGAIVRRGAHVASGAVLMPSFINIGAYVGARTMVDTWSTIGSCAQIGADCHISGGVGIGGVLEPLQAAPVIIEDNVFIGARSEIAEGVLVERGAVISMGVFIGASTKIIDRATGEVFRGRVPSGAVVVPGSLPGAALPDGSPGPSLSCAVIVKRVDEQTRRKTAINELLRD